MNYKTGLTAFTVGVLLLSSGFLFPARSQVSPSFCNSRLESGVYLFSGTSFTGRCSYYTGEVRNLTNSDVGNDTVSSIFIVGDYAATLYQNANFGGNASTFVNSTKNIGNSFVGDNRASSLRIVRGGCNGEPGVYLYEDSNFRGRCTNFKGDAADFRTLYIQPNAASSIKLIGDWVVIVYSDANFGGRASRFETNDTNFGDNTIGHDRASSIRVNPRQQICDGGPGVYLYSSKDFTGTCSRFTSTVNDLATSRIGNNAASSIQLIGGYSATLQNNQDRDSTTFTADDPDLSNDAVGDNHATSITVTGPNPEQENVYRIQIRLETGDVENAGTDDDILVSLNQFNFTWLDYGRDDFERGDRFTYDLLLDRIPRVSEIKWITFNKTGSDGWCLKSLELWINNERPPNVSTPPVRLYRNVFPSCRWLDNENGDNRSLVITFKDLRAQTLWQQANVPGPTIAFDSSEIVNRIESIVGHSLHNSRAFWGESHGDSVEIKGFDDPNNRNDRIHVDLDLATSATVMDIEVDVDFDILVTCTKPGNSTSKIELTVANVKADVTWFADWWGGGVEDKIEKAFPAFQQSIDTEQDFCPNITIRGDGTVIFF